MNNSSRKRLIASSAAYILGLSPKIKISGTHNQVERFKEVLDASKDLYFVLQEGTYSDVKNNLSKKKKLAKKFHQEFGWQWPF